MNHPGHHIKKMLHVLKHHPVSEHEHWPLGPLLFYLAGIIFLIAYLFLGSDWHIDFLITSIVCLAFAFILAEMITHMID